MAWALRESQQVMQLLPSHESTLYPEHRDGAAGLAAAAMHAANNRADDAAEENQESPRVTRSGGYAEELEKTSSSPAADLQGTEGQPVGTPVPPPVPPENEQEMLPEPTQVRPQLLCGWTAGPRPTWIRRGGGGEAAFLTQRFFKREFFRSWGQSQHSSYPDEDEHSRIWIVVQTKALGKLVCVLFCGQAERRLMAVAAAERRQAQQQDMPVRTEPLALQHDSPQQSLPNATQSESSAIEDAVSKLDDVEHAMASGAADPPNTFERSPPKLF